MLSKQEKILNEEKWWPGAELNCRHADFQNGSEYPSPVFSITYRDARCQLCTIMHNRAQLIHAKFTQQLSPFSSAPVPKADSVPQSHPTAEMVIVRFASFPAAKNAQLDPTSLPACQAVATYLDGHINMDEQGASQGGNSAAPYCRR